MRTKRVSQLEVRARTAAGKLRVSPNLAVYFQGKKVVFQNYHTRESFLSDPSALQVISVFNTWKTPSQAARLVTGFTRKSVLEIVERLQNLGILIQEGSDQEIFGRMFRDAWLWPFSARSFHFSTKIREYSTREEDRRYFEKNLKGKRGPSIFKTYPGSVKTRLLGGSGSEAPFFGTLRRRRTIREFSGEPISLKQFSRIVNATWGWESYYETSAFGRLLHKGSPSAGGRHPIEMYAIVNNVEGLRRGLYHYSVKDDSLELLTAGDLREKCVEYCAGQDWVRQASAVFLMTAVVARTQWKYREPRAYRALLLDTGHLSQTFLLTANALGLGAFCIGIIADLLIEKDLGLDGVSETALFAVGAGRPVRRTQSNLHKPDGENTERACLNPVLSCLLKRRWRSVSCRKTH
jgi:SagB-type dehydrogenase family enzyme